MKTGSVCCVFTVVAIVVCGSGIVGAHPLDEGRQQELAIVNNMGAEIALLDSEIEEFRFVSKQTARIPAQTSPDSPWLIAIHRNMRGAEVKDIVARLNKTDIDVPIVLLGAYALDSDLYDLAGLKNLTELWLVGCNRITSNAWSAVVKLPKLKRLRIISCVGLDDKALELIGQMGGVVSLDLAGCTEVMDKGIVHIGKMRNLQHLDLTGCAWVRDVTPLYVLEHLRSLCLPPFVSDRDVATLLRKNPGLREIGLRDCGALRDLSPVVKMAGMRKMMLPPATTDRDLAELVKGNPGLVALGLQNCQVRDLRPLSSLRQLRILTLGGFRGEIDIAPLGGLEEQLVTLSVWGNGVIRDLSPVSRLKKLRVLQIVGPSAGGSLAALRQLNRLEQLSVAAREVQDVQSLAELRNVTELYVQGWKTGDLGPVRGMTALRHLVLDEARTLVDVSAVRRLVGLESLSLSRCSALQGFGALEIPESLRSITLDDCPELGDAGVGSLSKAVGLRALVVRKCPKITDNSLRSFGCLKQLRTLTLNACDGITDAGLGYLADATQLREIDVGNCQAVGDAGIRHMAKLKDLEVISLEDCSKVSVRGVLYLAGLKRLKRLVIPGEWSPEISNPRRSAFRQVRPDVVVLDGWEGKMPVSRPRDPALP